MALQLASRTSAAGLLAKFNSRFWACVHGPRAARRWDSRSLPFASLRVPSGARIHGRSPNSVRSLRSLRSNSGDESVQEARGYARGHEFCAPRLRLVAPAAGDPRAWSRCCWAVQQEPTVPARRQAGRGRGDLGAAEQRRIQWPRAYPRASSSDSPHVFERRERSERSELCSGPLNSSSARNPPRSEGQAS
jgi:hypothetical protein